MDLTMTDPVAPLYPQMSKNMEDLLWRGDSLDRMSTLSSSLRDESLKYRKAVC